MNRRLFLLSMAGGPVLAGLLAACGDPDTGPADTGPADTGAADTGAATDPPTTKPTGPAGLIDHPTGADEVVFRVRYENGFVPMSAAFQRMPAVLVSGDGRVFRPGAQIAIYPGPLLPAITVASITETGVQHLLDAARTAGLLVAPVPKYDSAATTQIVDAPETAVVLSADGATFEHRAYALGIASGPGEDAAGSPRESTPDRRRLFEFVQRTENLAALVGADQLGGDRAFDSTEFRLRAKPVTPDEVGSTRTAPSITPWPTATGVRLASASSCVIAKGTVVADVLGKANTLSLFTEDGITYQLDAAQRLPGESCV